jgi:hypothetical protein
MMAKTAKGQNKTQPTAQSPHAYISNIEHPQRREDGLALLDFFTSLTGLPPVMWGESIIGYGRYHYVYESGREGDFLMTGFSPRKTALSIYVLPGYQDMSDLLMKLGKHKTGKSCLYINKLEDIDMHVLEEIILRGLDYMRSNYETWDK